MAKQEKRWQDFYEFGWKARSELLEEYLNQGFNAYQAIKKFESFERFHEMNSISAQGVKVTKFIPKTTEQSNIAGPNIPIFKPTSMSGQICKIPFYSDFNFSNLLVDILNQDEYDCVIELGCGYGRNLFNIFYSGGPINANYFGGEFTNSGVEIATKLAKKARRMKVKFFHFNHLEPNLDFITKKKFKKALVFTSHSIEQVTQINENWFEVVSKAANFVRGVHLEPFGFQMKELGPATKLHKEFFAKNSWNQNFAEVFIKAQNEKIISLDGLVLEIGFGDPVNPGSLLFWYSKK